VSKKRFAIVAATALAAIGGAAAIIVPIAAASAADCATTYSSSKVYTGGMSASYGGHNWNAKWWTQGETPSKGGSGVWDDKGSCGGGGTTPPPPPPNNPPPGGGTCYYPDWHAGTSYAAGAIVKYTNGKYYKASHENPGYDPIISTWFWDPYTCSGGGNTPAPPPPPNNPPPGNGSFIVSEAQFNQMFPSRNALYNYQGLVNALSAYPSFGKTGTADTQKQEVAAFLANIDHETGGMIYTEELNTAVWGTYCDRSQSYGCPAGQTAYHGRGPMQLSWNFNYKAAGDALNVDLLNHPDLVKTDSAIAWKTGIWYWMTGTGSAGMTSHSAMTNGSGFGTTIRAINGIECNGGHPDQMQSRVNKYKALVQILGTSTGPGTLTC
jgi:predicted chitinase/chitodextrinase